MKREFRFWEYVVDFARGLGLKDLASERICNAAYIAMKKLGLDVPDDFKPEGTAGVISPTIAWELYAVQTRGAANPLKGKFLHKDAFDTGRLLSKYDPDTLVMTSLYIMYDGRYPEIEKERKIVQRLIRELETYKQKKMAVS